MKAPFKIANYENEDPNILAIVDEDMNVMAENIKDPEFARLVCGLMNGHFGVHIHFESIPFELKPPVGLSQHVINNDLTST